MNAQSIGTIGTLSMFGLTAAGLVAGTGLASREVTPIVRAWGETISGFVEAADLEGESFTLRTEDDRELDVTFDAQTTFTLNGEPSSAEAVLVDGVSVSVTVDENGLASNVSRTTE